MELLRVPTGLAPVPGASALAIGNFDGVHLGHQALLAAVDRAAVAGKGRRTVLTFEPHPREVLARATAPARLQRLREKAAALATLGVERLVVARFNRRLQAMSAAEFVDEVLVRALQARHVVVGEGFRFGAGREGTVESLREAGAAAGFDTEVLPAVKLDGERVSSTGIRAALAAGDLAKATRWLGRPYALLGRVVHGRKLGRTLGYPTLNLRLLRPQSPLAGIFAVRVSAPAVPGAAALVDWPGVASLGTRPTVEGNGEPLLEVHLFDWQGDLYGRLVSVEFVAYLREERRFDGLPALVAQMDLDARAARAHLAAAAA